MTRVYVHRTLGPSSTSTWRMEKMKEIKIVQLMGARQILVKGGVEGVGVAFIIKCRVHLIAQDTEAFATAPPTHT